jgi:MFS family permease
VTPLDSLDGIRRRYLTILALRWLPMAFVLPVLILVLQDAGLSLQQVGVVIAVFSTSIVVLELPTGGLADAIGARPVLVVAAVLDVVGTGLLLLMRSLPGLLVAGVLMGVARALDSGPLEAWFVTATRRLDPSAALRPGLSRGEMVAGVTMAAGALTAGLLPKVLTGAGVLAPLRLPVLAAVVFGAVRVVATLALLDPVVRPAGAPALTNEIRRIPGILRDAGSLVRRSSDLRRLLLVAVAIGFSIVTYELLWQPRLADLVPDISERTELLGFTAAGIFVASAAGAGLAPGWARRWGRQPNRAAAAGTVLAGMVGMLCFLAATPAVTIAGVLAVYLTFGMVTPLKQELLHEAVGHDHRTTVVSANSLSSQGGNLTTQLVMFPLAATAGVPLVWLIAGGVLAASAWLYRGVGDRADRPWSAPRDGGTIEGLDPC